MSPQQKLALAGPAIVGEASVMGDSAQTPGTAPPKSHSKASKSLTRSSYLFCLPYVILLTGFGILPAIWAVIISFSDEEGGFAWFAAYIETFQDFRYLSVFVNIGTYAFFFVFPAMIISVGIALLLQGRAPRVGSAFRFSYYLPQALAGAAGVVAWIFMLNPATSPAGWFMERLDLNNIFEVLNPSAIAPILAMIAVWTSGNAILLMYAALSSIPAEILEAARVDGANAWTTAIHIKLPMLRKWIGYTFILNIAAATQLFVEPQILSSATGGAIGDNFSPLQLTYTFAYSYGNFPAAAALSVQMLLIAGGLAAIVLKKIDMFRVEI